METVQSIFHVVRCVCSALAQLKSGSFSFSETSFSETISETIFATFLPRSFLSGASPHTWQETFCVCGPVCNPDACSPDVCSPDVCSPDVCSIWTSCPSATFFFPHQGCMQSLCMPRSADTCQTHTMQEMQEKSRDTRLHVAKLREVKRRYGSVLPDFGLP